MLLQARCHECKASISWRIFTTDRVELSKTHGEHIEMRCKECGAIDNYHVDELKAQNSRQLKLIALLIMIAGTALIIFLLRDYLFHYDGSLYLFAVIAVIIAIPSFMFRILTKSEQQKLKRFNRYKLRQ